MVMEDVSLKTATQIFETKQFDEKRYFIFALKRNKRGKHGLVGSRRVFDGFRSDGSSALFGRNNFFNGLDLLLDFVNLRMHVPDQIMLGLGKLFDARCHFMQLFQHRILTG